MNVFVQTRDGPNKNYRIIWAEQHNAKNRSFDSQHCSNNDMKNKSDNNLVV